MNLWAVRIHRNRTWHAVRYYATQSEAASFAVALMANGGEYDIKEVSLEEANRVGA
jgi:hypothetical protein